jgi:hypothetical protein
MGKRGIEAMVTTCVVDVIAAFGGGCGFGRGWTSLLPYFDTDVEAIAEAKLEAHLCNHYSDLDGIDCLRFLEFDSDCSPYYRIVGIADGDLSVDYSGVVLAATVEDAGEAVAGIVDNSPGCEAVAVLGDAFRMLHIAAVHNLGVEDSHFAAWVEYWDWSIGSGDQNWS